MRKSIAIVALGLALASCGQSIEDQLVYELRAPPQPQGSFTYYDNWGSDKQLYASLNNLYDVSVNFSPSKILPNRLGKWKYAVDQAGNNVLVCDTVSSSGFGFSDVLTGLRYVVDAIYSKEVDRVLYGPAKNFNSIIEYSSDTGNITGMRFVGKDVSLDEASAKYGSCKAE